jgi:hypothetical protein
MKLPDDFSNAVLTHVAAAFHPFVQRFREQIVRFVNCLNADLTIGTSGLCRDPVNGYSTQARETTAHLIEHLGLLEQLEQDTVPLDLMLIRLVKLLH